METGETLVQEYRFRRENSLSFWGKLGEFCEELGEFVLHIY